MIPSSEERDQLFLQELRIAKKMLLRRSKWTQNQIQKCLNDIENAYSWESQQYEAELLQNHYHLLKRGLEGVQVYDWKKESQVFLKLDPKLTPAEEVAWRFKKSKKLKKAIPYLEKRLNTLQQSLERLHQWTVELESVTSSVDLNHWCSHIPLFSKLPPTKQKAEEAKQSPYFEYVSASGMKIWVGKSARSNEKLTFSIARGSDWWLHVSGYPGSHVIIRVSKNIEPDQETIKDAIQLALHYSKAKDRGEGDVCITQCKYVSKFGKNQVGKVQISKHKSVFARSDPARYQELKQREKNT